MEWRTEKRGRIKRREISFRFSSVVLELSQTIMFGVLVSKTERSLRPLNASTTDPPHVSKPNYYSKTNEPSNLSRRSIELMGAEIAEKFHTFIISSNKPRIHIGPAERLIRT